MEPRIEIRRMQLDYRVPPSLAAGGAGELRARLDEVAARVLPALLERALAPLDDGRLVVLRRVSGHVRLGALAAAGEVMPWATRWAESLAAEVLRAVDEAIARGGAITETAAVFAGPVEAIAHYVIDALAGRLDRWCWRPSLGALAAARRALDATASPGDLHRQALATPTGTAAAEAIEWALVASGGALPSLVADLARAGCAARALAQVSAPVALRLLAALGAEAAAASSVGPAFAVLHRRALEAGDWPVALRALPMRDGDAGGVASRPDPDDPRNLLLLVALAVAERPDLRGAAHLIDDARSAMRNRAGADGPEPAAPRDPGPPSSARPESPEAPDAGPGRSPADADAAPTAHAGLLFLVPLVAALEIDRAILDEPLLSDAPGLLPVLYHVVVRLAPEAWADPLALALADCDAPPFAWGGPRADRPDAPDSPVMDEARAAAVLRAEARVVAAAHRHGLAAGAGAPAEQAAIATLRARAQARLPATLVVPPWLDELCTRFAARIAGLLRLRLGPLEGDRAPDPGVEAVLIRVIARPGRIARTRTHLDVLLPLDGVDLDVRRAALDVDPGWVPFLGRILRVHYA